MTPIEAIIGGIEALALAPNTYTGTLPEGARLPALVVAPYGGDPDPDLPLDWYRVQVSAYARSLKDATEIAQALYSAMHRRTGWTLSGWTALRVSALQTPFMLAQRDGQGGNLYRVACNYRICMREIGGGE